MSLCTRVCASCMMYMCVYVCMCVCVCVCTVVGRPAGLWNYTFWMNSESKQKHRWIEDLHLYTQYEHTRHNYKLIIIILWCSLLYAYMRFQGHSTLLQAMNDVTAVDEYSLEHWVVHAWRKKGYAPDKQSVWKKHKESLIHSLTHFACPGASWNTKLT